MFSVDVETDADDEEGQTENGSKMSDNQEKCDDQSENDGKSSPEQLNGEIPLPLWWPQLEHRKYDSFSKYISFLYIE